MRLVEILGQLAEIESLLIVNQGELTPEEDTKLKLFTESLIEKVDGYKHFFDRLDMSVSYWKAKENEAKQIRKALESNIDHAESYLKNIMLSRGVSELSGEEFIFKISPTAGEVVITDEQAAKECYGKEKITIEIDKKKVREDLENGINIDCAVIKQNYQLRAKAITKKITKEKKNV
jgi:hypothetical protein